MVDLSGGGGESKSCECDSVDLCSRLTAIVVYVIKLVEVNREFWRK